MSSDLSGLNRATHIPSGETALYRIIKKGFVQLQFDRFDHPHSHGWHEYPIEQVKLMDQDLKLRTISGEKFSLYPGPEVGGPMHNVLRRDRRG